jgi:hypothetical protein
VFVGIVATYNKHNDLDVPGQPFWMKMPSDIEKQIMGNTLHVLYIPVFNANHFMLLKVDIKWGVIMYGNSLVLHA